MSNPLHILYTSNLRGDLDLLPRVHTFLRYLKSLPIDESDVMLCAVQPQTPRILFLDLGNACSPDVWHCTATDGRSTLIALDAMGYHAANVTDALTPESRIRLRDNLLGMALVDPDHDFHQNDLLLTARREGSQTFPPSAFLSPRPEGEGQGVRVSINLTPSPTTHITTDTLHLADVRAGQIGMAQVSFLMGAPTLNAKGIFDLLPDTAPDPTIAATVDFIRSEARFYSRNHSTN
ncbi:MAG: hypothetical protein GC179_01095 [Anaerolineaceae bacterium]|nr:hypothetical protein [Anaerolineaceae bacterium]